jgi:AcrR family transcriptional regulator
MGEAMNADDVNGATKRAVRPGRKRDDSRDEAILDATRELLFERGYDCMTMDSVAERAGTGKATVYRRWPSKAQLTVDAILCSRNAVLTVEDIPDTGSLRGDLRSLQQTTLRSDTDWLMSGLPTELRDDPQVVHALHKQYVAPHTGLMADILERARNRGEIPPDRDLGIIALVGPAMITYQKITTGQPVDPVFLERLIDGILVPLATGCVPDGGASSPQ